MPTIAPYIAGRTPPRRTELAQMDWPSYLTSKQYGGMEQIGQTIVGLSEKALAHIERERIETQYIHGKALWAEKHDEFARGLRADPDFNNYLPKYKQFRNDLDQQILGSATSRSARKAIQNYINNQAPIEKGVIEKYAYIKERDFNRATALEDIERFERAGDANAAGAAIIKLRDLGFMDYEEAQNRLSTIQENVVRYNYKNLREVIWNKALEIGNEQGYDKAAKFIAGQKELEPTHRQQMINSFQFFYEMGEIKTQNLKSQKESELLQKLDGRKLEPSELDSENMIGFTEDEQKQWRNRLYNSIKPINKTNWDKYNKLEEKILDAQWGKTKREDVLSEIVKARYDKKSITDNEYNELKNRLGKDYPTDVMAALDRAFKEPMRTFTAPLAGIKLKDTQRQSAYRKALLDWLDRNYSEEKGYLVTPEDILTKAVVLSSFFRNAKDYNKLPEPDRIRIVDVETDMIYTIPKEQREEALKEMITVDGKEINKYRIIE